MKRIIALLLTLALLLPCTVMADTPVTLALDNMTLTLTLPDGWTTANAPQGELPYRLWSHEGLVLYARSAGSDPAHLTICAAPAEPGMEAGNRAWKNGSSGEGLISTRSYINTYAEYQEIFVTAPYPVRSQDGSVTAPHTRIIYAILVNGYEYTLEFYIPSAVINFSTEEIVDSLRFRPAGAQTAAPATATPQKSALTTTVTLPRIGITMEVPVGWFYGTPEMGMTSPLAIASDMTDEDFNLLFITQGLHFYSVSSPDGLVCYVSTMEELPALTEENADATIAALAAGIPVEPTSSVFIPRESGSFIFLQYNYNNINCGYLFGHGARGPFVLFLMAMPGEPFPTSVMNALMNSICVLP